MPSSNPTTGLGVAAYIQLAGTKITNPAGGSTVHPGGYANPINGQGLGANAGGVFPVAQYALTLSVSGGTGVYGSYDYGDPKSEAVAATLVDVQNNPVTISQYYRDNFVWEAYCAPAGAGAPAWYQPNNGSIAGKQYNAAVVTLGTSYGTYDQDVVITANAVGQCIVECQYPVYDNSLGDNDGSNPASQTPIMMIYAQIIVTVLP